MTVSLKPHRSSRKGHLRTSGTRADSTSALASASAARQCCSRSRRHRLDASSAATRALPAQQGHQCNESIGKRGFGALQVFEGDCTHCPLAAYHFHQPGAVQMLRAPECEGRGHRRIPPRQRLRSLRSDILAAAHPLRCVPGCAAGARRAPPGARRRPPAAAAWPAPHPAFIKCGCSTVAIVSALLRLCVAYKAMDAAYWKQVPDGQAESTNTRRTIYKGSLPCWRAAR